MLIAFAFATAAAKTMAYTFKDDGASLTYFRDYNKEVGTGDKTLVGNWVEERALRDEISTGRYMQWVNTTSDPKAFQKTYTKFTTRPDVVDTYRRTVVHSDHTPATEFCTTANVPDPGYSVYKYPPKGAREAILEKRAIELSKLEHEEVTLPPRYVSTYKNDFIAKDLPPSETLGRKVMMTQNMVGIKGAGDGLYRKETGIIPANRFPESAEPCPMGQTFTMTGLKPSRGFGLNTAFSQPIAEYTKGEEKD